MSRYPSYKRPIQKINGYLYIVHAEYDMDRVRDTSLVKEWLGVDHVFKVHSKGTLIFCEQIQDVEWEEVT